MFSSNKTKLYKTNSKTNQFSSAMHQNIPHRKQLLCENFRWKHKKKKEKTGKNRQKNFQE